MSRAVKKADLVQLIHALSIAATRSNELRLAALLGAEEQTVATDTVFGYSYREDGHCGAGAPRINMTVTDGTDQATYTAGCNSSSRPPATIEDLGDWTALTWTPANFIHLGPASVPLVGSEIVSVVIVFDEVTASACAR